MSLIGKEEKIPRLPFQSNCSSPMPVLCRKSGAVSYDRSYSTWDKVLSTRCAWETRRPRSVVTAQGSRYRRERGNNTGAVLGAHCACQGEASRRSSSLCWRRRGLCGRGGGRSFAAERTPEDKGGLPRAGVCQTGCCGCSVLERLEVEDGRTMWSPWHMKAFEEIVQAQLTNIYFLITTQ